MEIYSIHKDQRMSINELSLLGGLQNNDDAAFTLIGELTARIEAIEAELKVLRERKGK